MIRKAFGLLLWTAVSAGVALSSAGAADKVKLKMAEVVRSQFYIPMYVALSKGFVADEGLEVEMITANGGDRAGALLLSGQTEFALAGPEVPVYIYNGKSPDKPVIFCALTATDGLFLASRQKLDKFDWSMLNGKKIMGWRPGSTPSSISNMCSSSAASPPTPSRASSPISACRRATGPSSPAGSISPSSTSRTCRRWKRPDRRIWWPRSARKSAAPTTRCSSPRRAGWRRIPTSRRNGPTPIARGQSWMKTASEKDVAEAIAPFFPGLTIEDNIAVVSRYRTVGVPIWATSTIVDPAGLAKAQEIMVVGGVLPADKKVDYDKIVTNIYAEKAQQKFASK